MRRSWRPPRLAGSAVWLTLYFPGQHAARDRAIGHHPQAEGAGGRQKLHLGLAVHQIVIGLQRARRWGTHLPAKMVHVGDVPGVDVGQAPVADFAGADQVGKGLNDVLPGRIGVNAVKIVKVDTIGLEPPEAGIDGIHDVAPRQAAVVAARTDLVADLGGEDPGLALGFDGLADRALGTGLAVDVGRVDEVDALLEPKIEHAPRLRIAGWPAEHHGAQRDFRDLKAARSQRAIAHLCHGFCFSLLRPAALRLAPGLASAWRSPSVQPSVHAVLDHEPVDAVCLILLDHAVARRFAECAEIGNGAGIGGKNLQGGALWQPRESFSGLENWAGGKQGPSNLTFCRPCGAPGGRLLSFRAAPDIKQSRQLATMTGKCGGRGLRASRAHATMP